MIPDEPGPFSHVAPLTFTVAPIGGAFAAHAASLTAQLAPLHVALEGAHGTISNEANANVDGALDDAHAALFAAAVEADHPVDLSELENAAAGYASTGVDLGALFAALPPEAFETGVPGFTPPPEGSGGEPDPGVPPQI